MKKTFFFSMLLAASVATLAQSESQWRGEHRNGVYGSETGLLKSWAPEGPTLLWHYDGLGQGHTSTAIANGKIYITGMTDSTGYLYVFDLQGKLLTKKEYGMEWSTNFHGTRSTVNVNEGRLYIFSGRGVMYCWDENTLNTIWEKDFLKEFDGQNLKFGMNESPLIVGNVLYATPGGKVNNMVALNKKTGELIWTSAGTGRVSAYCSALYIGDLEIPQVVNALDSLIVAHHATTGELLWYVVQKNPHGHNPNTPIYENGLLFSTAGGGFGSTMLRLTNGGRSVETVWKNELDNKMGGAVKVGDYVYASGEKNRYWYCLDWKTGETKYKDDAIGVGDVIAADGMLFCYSDKGELALVKANPAKFEVLGKTKITLGTEQHWAHPVIHQGVLYLRHGNTLMAYKVK